MVLRNKHCCYCCCWLYFTSPPTQHQSPLETNPSFFQEKFPTNFFSLYWDVFTPLSSLFPPFNSLIERLVLFYNLPRRVKKYCRSRGHYFPGKSSIEWSLILSNTQTRRAHHSTVSFWVSYFRICELEQGHPTSIFGKYLFGRRFEI